MKKKSAVLIVDAQTNMFAPGSAVDDADNLLGKIKFLIGGARQNKVPVFFIQHDGPPNGIDEPHTPGWFVHPELGSTKTETIRKTKPNSFEGTELEKSLKDHSIQHLIIAGMQSEFCIEATCEGAVKLGFQVILVSDAHGTYSSPAASAQSIIKAVNDQLKASVELKTLKEVLAFLHGS